MTLNEKDKEFAVALSILLYLGFAACITAYGFQTSADFDTVFRILNGNGNYINSGVWIYAPFVSTKDMLKIAVAFLPSVMFSFFIRSISSRKAALLSAFGIPFVLTWDNIAQSVATLFFCFAIGFLAKNRRNMATALSVFGILAHRFAWSLWLVLAGIFLLPLEKRFNRRTLQIAGGMAVLAALGFFAATLVIYRNDASPCQLFGRQTFIISLPIWALLLLHGNRKFLFLFVAFFLLCFGIFAIGVYDQPQRRLILILEPFAILGIALSGRKIDSRIIVLVLICSLLLLSARTINEQQRTFEQSSNPTATSQIYQQCNGRLFLTMLYDKAMHARNS